MAGSGLRQANQVIRPEPDLERLVVLEKGPQNIDLVPGASVVNPILRILERIINVVDVNEHASFQRGQHFKNKVIHVTSYLRDVR